METRFKSLILEHQRVIRGHYVVNGDRHDGLQVSCNSVHIIYLRRYHTDYQVHVSTEFAESFSLSLSSSLLDVLFLESHSRLIPLNHSLTIVQLVLSKFALKVSRISTRRNNEALVIQGALFMYLTQ